MTTIQGRKKGAGRAPTEAADTLRSTQIAELALLVSEGECGGLVNGLKSVYLDGVPVENADGSRNFQNVDFAYTLGTQGQGALPGLGEVQAETAVGLQIDLAAPVVRTVTETDVDHVRVTIGVPQLTEQNTTTGDLNGSAFEFAIDVQSAGGGFVEKHRSTITGKTTSRYSRAVRVELTGAAPWDVRVRRVTADPASTAVVNRFFWDSFTTIRSVKLRYPNSAIAALRVNAQNFGRVPVMALDWMGMLMQVPTNYDPILRAYSGVWNGTFKWAWSNNPAWIFHLVLTHPRCGLGQFVPAALANKWRLYQIGQYCDTMVDNGRGGTEPRFTCNAYIQTRREAYTLLQELAAVFRAMSFWSNGTVDFSQDAPAEAELLYTPANVVDGDFAYADTSERRQHSVFIVKWNDLAQFGKAVPEVYVDPELVARYGVREVTLDAFGCTSRGQAARAARWAAYTERYEGEVVSFAVGSDGVVVLPGRVFKIADPSEAGERLGGRIRTATAAQVTLDADVTLGGGEGYTLSVLQPDAADSTNFTAEARTVTTAPGTTNVLNVSPAFSAAPAAETVWLLESTTVEATWWRCLEVEELPNRQYRVNAVRHFPGKYAAVELGLKLDPRPVSRLSLQPARPASMAISETPYLSGSVTRSRVTVSWPEPARGLTYLVSWRLANGPWTDLPATSGNSIDVDGLARGLLEVSVRSVNAFGNASPPTNGTRVLLGKTARPGDVAGFGLALIQGAALATWAPNTEADYLTTEIRSGASWAAGVTIFEGAASRFQWAWPALGAYTLWAKHFDTSLGESLNAVSAAVNVTEAIYTQWQDLRGAGLPANNATSDLALVARGVQTSGNSAWKAAGTLSSWDADCYSVDSYTGGAFSSAVPAQTNANVMFGLNTDPAFNPDFATIDYALLCGFGGALYAYESGGDGMLLGAYAANDVLAVVYDGSQVRYMRNGTVLRSVAAVITAPLYLDTSFYTPAARLDKLRFGPMTSNAWGAIGGRPADAQMVKNLLNPATWVPDSAGSQPGFNQNPTSAGGANYMAYDTAPDGSRGVLWRARSGSAAGDSAEGGWDTPALAIDHTRMYRFMCWMRVFGANQSGNLYLGCGGGTVRDIGGGVNGNPYFFQTGRSVLPADEWVLVVGYVMPSTYTGVQQFNGGVWRALNGQKIFGGTDFRWVDGQQQTLHRAYQYYTNQAGNFQDFFQPRIELCDGSETPIDQLLAGAAARNAAVALGNAAAAQGSANTANSLLSDIASDAKLTPAEKQQAKLQWDAIVAEKAGVEARADAYAVTTEKTFYTNAYDNLAAYIVPLLADLAATSDIVGATFRSIFATLYTQRQTLLNKIAEVAGTRASWAGVSGAGKPQDNATVGAPAGTSVGGVLAEDLVATAADAAAGAATANAKHAELASDSKLTPVEKQTARLHWDAIQDEKPGIDARADAMAITTLKTAYGSAYSALSSYISPLLADLASTSDIVGADYRWAFANLYATRQALLNKVAEEASKRAEWAGVGGTGKPQDNATVGGQFGVNITGQAQTSDIAAGALSASVDEQWTSQTLYSGAATSQASGLNVTATDAITTTGGPLLATVAGNLGVRNSAAVARRWYTLSALVVRRASDNLIMASANFSNDTAARETTDTATPVHCAAANHFVGLPAGEYKVGLQVTVTGLTTAGAAVASITEVTFLGRMSLQEIRR